MKSHKNIAVNSKKTKVHILRELAENIQVRPPYGGEIFFHLKVLTSTYSEEQNPSIAVTIK